MTHGGAWWALSEDRPKAQCSRATRCARGCGEAPRKQKEKAAEASLVTSRMRYSSGERASARKTTPRVLRVARRDTAAKFWR